MNICFLVIFLETCTFSLTKRNDVYLQFQIHGLLTICRSVHSRNKRSACNLSIKCSLALATIFIWCNSIQSSIKKSFKRCTKTFCHLLNKFTDKVACLEVCLISQLHFVGMPTARMDWPHFMIFSSISRRLHAVTFSKLLNWLILCADFDDLNAFLISG